MVGGARKTQLPGKRVREGEVDNDRFRPDVAGLLDLEPVMARREPPVYLLEWLGSAVVGNCCQIAAVAPGHAGCFPLPGICGSVWWDPVANGAGEGDHLALHAYLHPADEEVDREGRADNR